MNVSEALIKIQGRTGFFNKASISYADAQIRPDESIKASVTANIFCKRSHFPGIVVITNRRIFAAFRSLGIKRLISCPIEELTDLTESESAMTYRAFISTKTESFSISLSPAVGKNFSRYLLPLKPSPEILPPEADLATMSSSLHSWLKAAQARQDVPETDPLAVAVHLCEELTQK